MEREKKTRFRSMLEGLRCWNFFAGVGESMVFKIRPLTFFLVHFFVLLLPLFFP